MQSLPWLRPIRLENDANCFALSEAVDGAAAGAGSVVVLGVILGTGVGAGIVVDGRIIAGRNRIAGEWGHNPLPWADASERPGARCYCGKSGCIETFLCGAGLARDYHARAGKRATAEEIALAATCEGLYLTTEEEALFEQMDRERLTPDERAARIVQFSRAQRRRKALASS